MTLSELQSRVIDEVRSIRDDQLIALGIVLGVISRKDGVNLIKELVENQSRYIEAKTYIKKHFGLGD